MIRIAGVSKAFDKGGVLALENIDLDVKAGEFVCLLGPSGCGKSTLLNIVAGFTEPTKGTVEANGKPVTGPSPERAMVFQEYALFPWMTVAENVGFGLQLRGENPRTRVDQLLQQLRLAEFRDRFPKDLSGGMRQRVAIARALAIDPPVLLMDEPFGALDALTRRTLQDELLRLWSSLHKTVLFVTHGIDEALYLADRIVVLSYRPGRLKAVVDVTLPRPRDPAAPAFGALMKQVTALVLDEQERHLRDEAQVAPGADR